MKCKQCGMSVSESCGESFCRGCGRPLPDWTIEQCAEVAKQDFNKASAEYLDAPNQKTERELVIAGRALAQIEKLAKKGKQ